MRLRWNTRINLEDAEALDEENKPELFDETVLAGEVGEDDGLDDEMLEMENEPAEVEDSSSRRVATHRRRAVSRRPDLPRSKPLLPKRLTHARTKPRRFEASLPTPPSS